MSKFGNKPQAWVKCPEPKAERDFSMNVLLGIDSVRSFEEQEPTAQGVQASQPPEVITGQVYLEPELMEDEDEAEEGDEFVRNVAQRTE